MQSGVARFVAVGNKTGMETGNEDVVLGPARPADAAAISALLAAAGLPHGDFAGHLGNFIVARRNGVIIGAVGCEICGTDALLRSLVVAPEARGVGLGDRLVRALARQAAAHGVSRLHLLTATAEAFFQARGFVRTERAAVPPAVAATREFRSLCPATAVCMTRPAIT